MPLAFLLQYWRTISIAVLLAVTHGWTFYKGIQHEKPARIAVEQEFTTFKATEAAQAKESRQRAANQAAEDAKRKDDADKRHAQTVAALDTALRGLRATADDRPRNLPTAPTGSNRPDLACFDRGEYQREMGALDARLLSGSRGLADEGTASTLGLDSAKGWSQR